jgi:hypothetical protein
MVEIFGWNDGNIFWIFRWVILMVWGSALGVIIGTRSFPAKFFFCILEKEILAGKNLLFKIVNLF